MIEVRNGNRKKEEIIPEENLIIVKEAHFKVSIDEIY